MPEYTKDKIADTLMRLLANKSLDKITVKLLVSECGISRQSFYYYFQDILDVTQWLIRKKTNELLQKSLKQEDPRDIVSLYVDFAYDNKEMIGRLLDSRHREFIEHALMDSFRSYIQKLVLFRSTETPLYISDLESTLNFCTYGLTGMLLEHIGKKQGNRELLVQQMNRLLGRVLKKTVSDTGPLSLTDVSTI